jgi:Domain of unknown function (DUF1963)
LAACRLYRLTPSGRASAGPKRHFIFWRRLTCRNCRPLLWTVLGKDQNFRKPATYTFLADMVEEMLWGENGGPLATTRVIYTRRTGPERSPPDDTPDIGHPFGEKSSQYTKGNTAFTQAALEPHVIETFGGVEPFPPPDDTYAAAVKAAMVASIEKAIGAPLRIFTGPGSYAAIKAENPREYLQEFQLRDGTVRRELHCPLHQMLGVGKNIQGSAERARADGNILLMQIDSDRAVHEEFIFCDMGAAQFWIEPSNLAARRFYTAWGTTEGG